jgi:hypothetical protein
LTLLSVEVDVASTVLSQYLVIGLSRERWITHQKDMEDYSQTEDIANRVALSFEVFEIHNFRRDVARRAASNEQILGFISPCRQAKISNNTIIVTILTHEDVLGFEVTVHHSPLMHMLQSHK